MWYGGCFWPLTFAFAFVSALKLGGILLAVKAVRILHALSLPLLGGKRKIPECLRCGGPSGHQRHHSHLTNKTQRGNGTYPRTHSSSAAELGLEPSPPDSLLGSFVFTQEAWPHLGPRLFWAPDFSASQSFKWLRGVELLPRLDRWPSLPCQCFILPSPGLSPRCHGHPSWELLLLRKKQAICLEETSHLPVWFPSTRPHSPVPPRRPQDADQRQPSEGLS